MDRKILIDLGQIIDHVLQGNEAEAQLGHQLRKVLNALGDRPGNFQVAAASDTETLNLALQAIDQVFWSGKPPQKLPDCLADQAQLHELISNLVTLQQVALSIANGDLDQTLRVKGWVAGALKSLQASLRHLTWQTQQIAKGDLSQRVEFMGEFSEAFNKMVVALAEMRSQLKHREAELVQTNIELRHEIVEREQAEAALQQYASKLKAHNAELDAYAHTVAHDLKNPLNAMRGYAEMLAEDYGDMSVLEMQSNVSSIVQGARKMTTIVDALLTLASVRSQEQVKVAALDMGQIVCDALARLNHAVKDDGAQIVTPSDWPTAWGYAPWVEEIWTNYISNAIKYGSCPPRVELGATIQADGKVRFWVCDNGDGLSPEQQARLFVPFERLDQARIEGHGLGLSIVRRIVEKLAGQVGVESQGLVGQGSVFFFTLPDAQP